MFTGIIEAQGEVTGAERAGGNLLLTVRSSISDELSVGQSLSHDGICLTVTGASAGAHTVTLIEETLSRTTAGEWRPGRKLNLERAIPATGRFDGHFVQGHVDTVARCESRENCDGSIVLRFSHPESPDFLAVSKGSIALNGVSLTVVDAGPAFFSIALIPITLEKTNLGVIAPGTGVNAEFDIVGRYVRRVAGRN
jgi:riboflavin synthase